MSQRIDRVNELLKREIGTVVQKDYEWNGSLVTVSAVETTQDIKEAKVWISVLGGRVENVLEKLNHDHGSIQKKISKRVVLKSTPVLHFRHDGSAERGVEIVNLLDEVAKLPTAKDPEE
ncbi:30S ribosome-binding factor RbfA [Haloferula sp. BvORR071]|uniref:30S ribosome-binding factor RbfA n=1 Tax=Haloferula sp. BvORR071 TaxID=1396141 RepID=UPI0005553580|nr:30S ribosome-binding factor RbfA [Haloferula sp. BvORR071]